MIAHPKLFFQEKTERMTNMLAIMPLNTALGLPMVGEKIPVTVVIIGMWAIRIWKFPFPINLGNKVTETILCISIIK